MYHEKSRININFEILSINKGDCTLNNTLCLKIYINIYEVYKIVLLHHMHFHSLTRYDEQHMYF